MQNGMVPGKYLALNILDFMIFIFLIIKWHLKDTNKSQNNCIT